jgi:1,4-alpha-glucan branching enzyme
VCVRGDFNDYDINSHHLKKRDYESGIWEGFIENIDLETTYKYHILTNKYNANPDKADPFAFYAEVAPASASKIYSLDSYAWKDKSWMHERKKYNSHNEPICVYEVHLGSWKVSQEGGALNYIQYAHELSRYLLEMNFTHVELMPITEYPFEGSWGYQVSGYFAPTSRYGSPHEFMEFVDIMHQNGIGVILDWVPSHFVMDGHALMNFDGTCLYEHQDPRLGYHPQWGSAIFNYDREEVRSFLISSAMFWLEKYHIDGIRVDAVSSMLYLDYCREEGEWIPNKFGGNENLGAIAFLRDLNTFVYNEFEDVMMFAEESSAYPMVSAPVDFGGLGFGYKWNMGWMHDTLKYMKNDPVVRKHHHHELTFSFVYMYNENYILPLSHDEVVHMKGSLINKMAGDYNQKFANLRALYAFMTAHPGKKLLFMGSEIAQFSEWNYKGSLDWNVLDYPNHKGIQNMLKELNRLYKTEPALHRFDTDKHGFEWIDERDYESNVIAFIRKGDAKDTPIVVICNFSDHLRENYPVGIYEKGTYKEIFNSQSKEFEGWEHTNKEPLKSIKKECHGRKNMLYVTLSPLSVLFLKKL